MVNSLFPSPLPGAGSLYCTAWASEMRPSNLSNQLISKLAMITQYIRYLDTPGYVRFMPSPHIALYLSHQKATVDHLFDGASTSRAKMMCITQLLGDRKCK